METVMDVARENAAGRESRHAIAAPRARAKAPHVSRCDATGSPSFNLTPSPKQVSPPSAAAQPPAIAWRLRNPWTSALMDVVEAGEEHNAEAAIRTLLIHQNVPRGEWCVM